MSRRLNLKPTDAEALEEFTQSVRAALGPKLVGLKLFGSKATGRDLADSDVDVLVVVSETSVQIEDQVFGYRI